MKLTTNLNRGSRQSRPSYSLIFRGLLIGALALASVQTEVKAQEVSQYRMPSWWFGVAAGGNMSWYRGTTQLINSDLTVPAAFHHGRGIGLYAAPLVEFHPFGSRWGFMLQAGIDSRKGSFREILTPCNCPTDLQTDLRYLSFEPSLRFAPFKSNFYLFAGPQLSIVTRKSFIYSQEPNPDFPAQTRNPDIEGEFSEVKPTLISMKIGAGYDIPLTSPMKRTQIVFSPFASYHPYFGQNPRVIETWTVSALRVGAALKFGFGKKIKDPAKVEIPVVPPVTAKFAVNAPLNIPAARTVREIFPLRNYVFFNLGSTSIPDRYVLLTKDQVKDFKEDQLESFPPKNMSGRSGRQMVVYYNVINIIGDRMGKTPGSSITLVGSSEQGIADAIAMAESIKTYLTTVFGIDPSRIKTEGRDKPKLPSENPGGTTDLALLSEGNRRVSIESSSPEMLMEFQTGPGAPLKPVEIKAVQEAPLDSYVSFNVQGEQEPITTWSLAIKDEKGVVQNFGPYTKEKVSIPGKSILGTRPEGNFKVTMTGQTKDGKTVVRDTTVHMVLWTPPATAEGTRYSIIFEYDNAQAGAMYEKYLTEIVTPKIPVGGTVIIHGHTDIIGEDSYNQNLSEQRSAEVKGILQNALLKAGRSDVKFETLGFGEDENLAPFENKFPEERFYNRTVVIDIIPAK